MSWFQRNPAWAWGIRFVVLLALFLSPLPFLADAYTTVYGTAYNQVLAVLDSDSRYGFQFEPPSTLQSHGTWLAVLRVDDRRQLKTARMKLDTRAFSYRPLATYVAFALSARLKGRRKNTIVLAGGLAAMIGVTTLLALAAALRFGIGRVVGFGSGPVVETAYEALTTPSMQYAIPFICFCLLTGVREVRALLVAPRSPDSNAPDAPSPTSAVPSVHATHEIGRSHVEE
jgi:hypothetical protein